MSLPVRDVLPKTHRRKIARRGLYNRPEALALVQAKFGDEGRAVMRHLSVARCTYEVGYQTDKGVKVVGRGASWEEALWKGGILEAVDKAFLEAFGGVTGYVPDDTLRRGVRVVAARFWGRTIGVLWVPAGATYAQMQTPFDKPNFQMWQETMPAPWAGCELSLPATFQNMPVIYRRRPLAFWAPEPLLAVIWPDEQSAVR